MDRDNMMLMAMFMALLAMLVALILGSVAIACRHVEEMARLGYQETTVPGQSHTVWQRVSDIRPEAGRPAN